MVYIIYTERRNKMKKWNITESYLCIDYYKDIEAETKDEALYQIYNGTVEPDKTQTEDTETEIEKV